MTSSNIVPVVKVKKNTWKLYALSTDVSDYFEREHKNVLESVEKCLTEQISLAAEFSATKYSIKGRYYKRFEMSRTGFTYLVLGFTGRKSNQFKLDYINQFEKMEAFIRNSLESISGSIEMCCVLEKTRLEMGKETKAHHYINEHNLIYGVEFGCTAKQLHEELEVPENHSINEALTEDQVKELAELRSYNARLMVVGTEYQERKEKLIDFHEARKRMLSR